jgi:hypothetical protein
MITEASGQSAGPGAVFIRHRRDIRSRHASSTWGVTTARRNLEVIIHKSALSICRDSTVCTAVCAGYAQFTQWECPAVGAGETAHGGG